MDGKTPSLDGGVDREEQALDMLVRLAFERVKDRIVLPTEAEMVAYLSCTATEDQERAVRRAILGSPAFRRGFLSLVRHRPMWENDTADQGGSA